MMPRVFGGIAIAATAALLASTTACTSSEASAPAAARIGAAAPDFTLKDLSGKSHTLSSLKGKTVVLEWFNPGCPYVQHAHGEGGVLAALPAKVKGDDLVWIAINSGAPGKQGHGLETNNAAVGSWKIDYPVLIDEDGAVGRKYGAVTTPHMYIVDKAGNLVYQGAVDNRPLGKGEGEPVNYVEKALADVRGGRPVATADTKPYGCGVKY